MTEGYICVGANERAEVDFLTGCYCCGRAFVWENGTLCLGAIRLGYMRADGLKAPIEGSTLDRCERLIKKLCLEKEWYLFSQKPPLAVGFWRIS